MRSHGLGKLRESPSASAGASQSATSCVLARRQLRCRVIAVVFLLQKEEKLWFSQQLGKRNGDKRDRKRSPVELHRSRSQISDINVRHRASGRKHEARRANDEGSRRENSSVSLLFALPSRQTPPTPTTTTTFRSAVSSS